MIITKALEAYAAATARVFADRSGTVGASEVGACSRRTFLTKKEGDPTYGAARDPDYVDGWGATARGTTFENHFWVPAMQASFGNRLRYAGEEQRTLVAECLSATPDGLLVNMPRDLLAPLGVPDLGKTGELVLECKTADPRSKLDEPKPEHVFQAIVQMGLFREKTGHRPQFALLSYTNASFWNEIVEFVIPFNPKVYAVAKQRAADIIHALGFETLPPEGYIAGGAECGYCPFTRACGRARTSVPYETDAKAEPVFVAAITKLARQIKRVEQRLETTTAKLRGLQNELRERMRAKGVRRVIGKDARITWSAVKGRPSHDDKGIREAAAQAGVDLTQFETVGEPSDRLEIRIVRQPRMTLRRKRKRKA